MKIWVAGTGHENDPVTDEGPGWLLKKWADRRVELSAERQSKISVS